MSRLAILCPVGDTGNIVTMTVNKLLLESSAENNDWVTPYEEILVIVPYTKKSTEVDIIKQKGGENGELQKHWYRPPEISFATGKGLYYAKGYKWHPKIKINGKTYDEPGHKSEVFVPNLHLLLVPILRNPGSYTSVIKDIDEPKNVEQFQDLTYGLSKILTEQEYNVHISLTGGRKTMVGYQMTSAILYGAESGVSQVLEPSEENIKRFMEEKGISNHLLGNLEPQIHSEYQPLTDLYHKVNVKYINLSQPIKFVAQKLGFGRKADNIIDTNNFEKEHIVNILQDSRCRQKVYEIGQLYRTGFEESEEEIDRLFRRALISGLFTSFMRHEMASSQRLRKLPGKIRALNDIQNGYNIDRIEEVAEEAEIYIGGLRAISNVIKGTEGDLEVKCDKAVAMSKLIKNARILAAKGENEDWICLTNPALKLKVDEWLVSLAFANLMKNAWEAMEGKELKRLEIESKTTDEGVTITFTDTGKGVSSVVAERGLADPNQLFELAVSVKEDKTEHGVGLYVAREIVEAHDGEIGIEDKKEVGCGACVTIWIPKAVLG